MQNEHQLLTLILDKMSTIASIHDHEILLVELAKLGRDIVNANRCSIWILNKKERILWTKVAQGVAPIKLDYGVGLVGDAISKNEPLIINDVQSHPHFNSAIDKKTGFTTKTMMVIPMLNMKEEVIGAIQVINKKEGFFSDRDLKYLTLVSTYSAESLETILLMEEIEKTQKELIHIMGVTGENRSKETGNHVKRVGEYSYLLARFYGLSQKDSNILKTVSPMHDIGKIGIEDAILKKPNRLTSKEMNRMKEHTTIGFNILKNSELPLLRSASIVAYQHHEKYNGTGYPRGLKGDDIHIFGRITALADVFDALGSQRVYKPKWEDERIFDLLQEERGEHFEAKLVDIFLKYKDEFLAIRDKFKDE